MSSRVPTSGGVKSNALSPMKEDRTNRVADLLDRMDDSDVGDTKRVGGRIQLPPRNVIRCVYIVVYSGWMF